jgi:hypothetical protein
MIMAQSMWPIMVATHTGFSPALSSVETKMWRIRFELEHSEPGIFVSHKLLEELADINDCQTKARRTFILLEAGRAATDTTAMLASTTASI